MATSTSDTTLFQTSISRILDSWTVLKLAVENGFGGTESQEKAEWMVFAIDQWFKENKNLESFEVEDFLADVLNAEFDTVAEDDSLSQIASMICGVYRICSTGDEKAVKERLNKLPKPAVQQCCKAPSDEESDEDVATETGRGQSSSTSQTSGSTTQTTGSTTQTTGSTTQTSGSTTHTTGSTSQTSSSGSLPNGSANDMEMEDDGWTVVHRGKRK